MIPKSINPEKYAKEYLKDIQDDAFLMKKCLINEDVEYILSELDEDDDAFYDENYIREIVDLIVDNIKKLAVNKLQNYDKAYDVLYEISTEYMDIAVSLMSQEISKEEKYDIIYKKFELIYDNYLEKEARKKIEKELDIKLPKPSKDIIPKEPDETEKRENILKKVILTAFIIPFALIPLAMILSIKINDTIIEIFGIIFVICWAICFLGGMYFAISNSREDAQRKAKRKSLEEEYLRNNNGTDRA